MSEVARGVVAGLGLAVCSVVIGFCVIMSIKDRIAQEAQWRRNAELTEMQRRRDELRRLLAALPREQTSRLRVDDDGNLVNADTGMVIGHVYAPYAETRGG